MSVYNARIQNIFLTTQYSLYMDVTIFPKNLPWLSVCLFVCRLYVLRYEYFIVLHMLHGLMTELRLQGEGSIKTRSCQFMNF